MAETDPHTDEDFTGLYTGGQRRLSIGKSDSSEESDRPDWLTDEDTGLYAGRRHNLSGKPAKASVAVNVVQLGSTLDSGRGTDATAEAAGRRKRSPATRLLLRGDYGRRGARKGDKMYQGRQTPQQRARETPRQTSQQTPQQPIKPAPRASPAATLAPRQTRPGGLAGLGATLRRRSREQAEQMRRRISLTSTTVLRRLSDAAAPDGDVGSLRKKHHRTKSSSPVGNKSEHTLRRLRDEAKARRAGAGDDEMGAASGDSSGSEASERPRAKPVGPSLGDDGGSEDSSSSASRRNKPQKKDQRDSPSQDAKKKVLEPRNTRCSRAKERGDPSNQLRSNSFDTSMKIIKKSEKTERESKGRRRNSNHELEASFCRKPQLSDDRRKDMFSKAAMERRRLRRRSNSEAVRGHEQKTANRKEIFSKAAMGRRRSRRRSSSEGPLGYKERMALCSEQSDSSSRNQLVGGGKEEKRKLCRSESAALRQQMSRPSKTRKSEFSRSQDRRKGTRPSMSHGDLKVDRRKVVTSDDRRRSLNDLRGDERRSDGRQREVLAPRSKNVRAKKSLNDHLANVDNAAPRTEKDKRQSDCKKQNHGVPPNVASVRSGASSRNSRSERSDRSREKSKKHRVSSFMICMACLWYIVSIMLFTAFGFWLHMMFMADQNNTVPTYDDPGEVTNASPGLASDAKALEPSLQPSYNYDGQASPENGTANMENNESFVTKLTPSTPAPSSSDSPTRTKIPSSSPPSASPTTTVAPSTRPSLRPSTFPSASPTQQASNAPSISSSPSMSPSDWPSSSPTASPGCPDLLLRVVALDDAGLLTMRYEVVIFQGDTKESLGGLLCVSLEYTGGAAGWLGLAFSEASRLPEFGRREAIIGMPGIVTSVAVSHDGDATLGQQNAAMEGGPMIANPGKYVIPAGGEDGYYGPSLQWLRDMDEQTLMDGSVSAMNAHLDPSNAVSDFMSAKMSFVKYLREPGEIAIDPYGSTLLMFAVAAVPSSDEDQGNPEWQSIKLQLLGGSSDYVRPGLVRKRTRHHLRQQTRS